MSSSDFTAVQQPGAKAPTLALLLPKRDVDIATAIDFALASGGYVVSIPIRPRTPSDLYRVGVYDRHDSLIAGYTVTWDRYLECLSGVRAERGAA